MKSPLENFHYYSKNLEFRKPPGFLEFGKFKFPMKILYLKQKFDYPHAKKPLDERLNFDFEITVHKYPKDKRDI